MLVTPGAILFEADALEEASVTPEVGAVTPDTYSMIAPIESIVNIIITHDLLFSKSFRFVFHLHLPFIILINIS